MEIIIGLLCFLAVVWLVCWVQEYRIKSIARSCLVAHERCVRKMFSDRMKDARGSNKDWLIFLTSND